MDKYETVKYEGLDRPEYILKNGKARNAYGLLKDIQALQAKLNEIIYLNVECDAQERLYNQIEEIVIRKTCT